MSSSSPPPAGPGRTGEAHRRTPPRGPRRLRVPFPEREEECRTVPGRLMWGVQFFEAHIGCQLLPTSRSVDLLERAGFREVGVIDVTPVHVVVHGTK